MRSTIGQAEPAPAGASTQERSRRRRRTVMGGNADEYMDIVSDLDAPPVGAPAASAASNRGAGSLGFSGTVSAADGVRPEGVIALADGFGAGPTEPRLPQTRGSDRSEESPGFGGPEDAGQAEGGSNEVATARESW
jgi:PPE-PPW subfamily C-terminal region